jgi:O-antigen ligase
MEMIVWNAAALAVLGFIQQATDAEGPFWATGLAKEYFFASFGYANMGGAFFVMAFAFSIGVWLTRVAEVAKLPPVDKNKSPRRQKLHRWLRAHYPLIPAALNMFAVLSTLCRAAMINLIVIASLAFLYFECSLFFSHRHRAKNIKKAAVGLVFGILVVVSMFVFGPKNWTRELDSVSSLEVLNRVSGKGHYHSRVATEIFKDHPFFGVGGWGYKHFSLAYMTDDDMAKMQVSGGANVHNDCLQFLCEHGVVGFGLLVCIVALLVVPLLREWFTLYRAARFARNDTAPPSPRALYCLPAGTLWILAGDIALLCCSFGDCPMRSLAVLAMFFVSLACAEGYLPRIQESDE